MRPLHLKVNSTLVKSGQPSGFIMLNQEETIVRIKVNSLSKEYLTDIWLKSLTLSDISLSPVFKPEITEYTAIIDGSFDTYTVTPEAIEGAEKIIVNQQVVDSSKASLPIYLREGKNKLKVTVYAHNNDLVKTYTITIKKLKKVPSLTASAKLDNEKQVLIQGNTGMKFSLALPVLITDPNGKIEYANFN